MMEQLQFVLTFKTQPKSFKNITDELESCVSKAKLNVGLCHLFVQHTSASLIIQENADPDVLKDVESFFSDLVPQSRHYRHSDEGKDDMPAHIRTLLSKTSEVIPVSQGRLMLGTWQGVYLWEHRETAHERKIVVHLIGESCVST